MFASLSNLRWRHWWILAPLVGLAAAVALSAATLNPVPLLAGW